MPSIARAAAVALSVLSIVAMSLPSAAANELETYTLEEYEDIVAKELPDVRPISVIDMVRLGMASGLKAAQEDYDKVGEKPLFCLPMDLSPHVGPALVKEVIADELAARGDIWRRTPNVFIETVLVEGMRRQYPCDRVQSDAMATMMRVHDYRLYRSGMEKGDKGSTQTLFYFLLGMQATLKASGDAYVARGAKRHMCMPMDTKSFDMITAIDRELARDSGFWDSRRDADIGPLVIAAFKERWSCK